MGVQHDRVERRKELRTYLSLRGGLISNSFIMMITSIIGAAVGFFFWTIAARKYSEEDVGIGIALISSSALIVVISRIGLEHSLIRYFPSGNKVDIFTTTWAITTAFAAILAIILVISVDYLFPALAVLRNYAIPFIILIVCNSLISTAGIAFIAMRKPEFYLYQNIVTSSRVIFLFPFAGMGAIGIFGSYGLSLGLASLASLYFLRRTGVGFGRVDPSYLKGSAVFSAGNYIGELLTVTPNQIIPIMTLNILGASAAAKYYIGYIIASVLFVVPSAIGTSLFVEGSHGRSLREESRKALISGIGILAIPALAIGLVGNHILALFGQGYQESLDLLRLMVLVSFPLTIYSVYYAVNRVQKNVKALLYLSMILFVTVLLSVWILAPTMGLIGIGYAWLIAYGLAGSLSFASCRTRV